MILKLFLILILISLVTVKIANGDSKVISTMTQFMIQLEELKNQNATSPCIKHIQDYFKGLENQSRWAFQMLDSTSKFPVGFLKGNQKFFGLYDECLSVQHPNKSFIGKHCLVRINDRMTSIKFIQKLAKERTQRFLKFPKSYDQFTYDVFGICMPSTCNVKEILNLIQKITNATDEINIRFSLTERDCSTKEPIVIAEKDWIFIYIFLGFVILAAASTMYDIIHILSKRAGKPNPLLVSFSLLTNGKSLFSRSKIPNDIQVFYGMRALTMSLIVLNHSSMFTAMGPSLNYFDSLNFISDKKLIPLMNNFLGVDTFFFMSGFLVYASFNRSIVRTGSFDVPLAYIHRYIRLTPAFAAILVIQMQLIRYFGDGPMWKAIAEETSKQCSEMWWHTITYIQNYASPISPCLAQTWYLSVDMQYYWASPFILYPLHYKPKVGIVLMTGLIIASIISSFHAIYTNNLGPSGLITPSIEDQFRLEYIRTETRAASWLIGLSLGYIIYTIENKNINVKLSKHSVTAGWLITIGLFLGSLYSIAAFTDFKYTPLKSAFYVPLHRLGWILAMSWIVFACVHGYGGFVNTFLSAGFFKPMSRLSYSVFLIHYTLQFYRVASQRTNYYGSVYTFTYFYYGDLIMSNLLAVPLALLFEIPFCNTTKTLLKNANILPIPKRRKLHVVNDVKRGNGGNEIELGNVNNGFQHDCVRL